MRVDARLCLALAFPLALNACAASIPPPSTFVAADWAAVEALAPGTRIEVAYVMGEPKPLRYSFTGEIDSVDGTFLSMRTSEGQQRLLSERVLRVSRIGKGGNRAPYGMIIGAAAGAVLGVFLAPESPGEGMRFLGAIGALIGASGGSLIKGELAELVYQRR